MSLMHNVFDGRPEVIFITYEDVIKTPYPFLLYQIIHKYRHIYDEFLHLDTIEKMDMKNLYRFCLQRTNRNVLVDLAKREFDVDEALSDLKKKFFNIYENCELLAIGNSLPLILSQKFTKKIYVHTEEYDIRVHMDLQKTYHNMTKVNYVTGNLVDVLDALPEPVTTFILNDITDVGTIIFKQKEEYTNILVASYGYNYTLNEEGKMILRVNIEDFTKDRIFKFATFIPQELTEDHFTVL